MAFIEEKQLASIAVKYEEDIESITIFPQSGDIEVKTYKRFYDSKGAVVRTESGTIEKFKQQIPEVTDRLLTIMKSRRGR